MRMIPPVIASSTRSNAERLLFYHLSRISLPEDYCCLHSVELPEHLYKVCGELDFVVIGPRGLYVIEVKGGEVSRTSDGIWLYTSRNGHSVRNSEGPFQQARSGMFSLRNRLLKQFSFRELSQIVMGYGVAFPEHDFNLRSIEWDEKQVLDGGLLASQGVLSYLKTLEEYWHNKLPTIPQTAPSDLVKRILQVIRPEFELIRSLHIQLNEVEGRLIQLTTEQYEKLDLVETSHRILIEGGAGTGKTFLALEVARREALKGQSVLLACFSPVLAAFLSTQIKTPGVQIRSLHSLMLEVVEKYSMIPPGYSPEIPSTDLWFINTLVPAFSTAIQKFPDDQRYDVLIIDEAQDILNVDYLLALEDIVQGGLKDGKWRIFYDRFNQGAIFGAVDPDVLKMLIDYQTTGGPLHVNCRNTDEIVIQTKLATGADLGNRSTGPGPEVIYKLYHNENEAAALLESYLEDLLKKRIDLREITILSPYPYVKSSVSRLSSSWRRRITQLGTMGSLHFPFTGLTFSTVADFKGLENRVIALTDINDLDSTPAALATLYVGMSRARGALWIAMNSKLRRREIELVRQHLPEVREDMQHDR